MLLSLGVTAFAETGYTSVSAKNWGEVITILNDLNDGAKVEIKVEKNNNGVVNVDGCTAYISANDVEIKFVERYFKYRAIRSNTEGVFFKVTGDNVTLDFGGSRLESKKDSAIVVDGDKCMIKNAYFYYCENALGKGGAIRITDNAPGCRIIDCRFDHCRAKQGSGVYIDSDDATIEGCSFIECQVNDIYDNKRESVANNCKTTNTLKGTFYRLKEMQNCEFGWNGSGSTLSEGNVWIIAGVAAVAVAAVAVVIVKKKKTKTEE